MNRGSTILANIFRNARERARGSVTTVIVWTCAAVFVLVFFLDRTGIVPRRQIVEIFGLSYHGVVERLWVHQYVTAALLHGGIGHLVFNLLALWMLGPGVEQILGRGRYLFFSLLCAACGFTTFLLLNRGSGAIVIGYSGVIFGILVAQAVCRPNSVLYFFGLFPLRMKHAVLILGAIELYLTVSPGNDGIAHAAHLFGALGAFIYLKFPALPRSRRWRTAPMALPPKAVPLPESVPLSDWGRPGEVLAEALDAIGHGRYADAQQCLAQTPFPRNAADVAESVKRLVRSVERYARDPSERAEQNMHDITLSLWKQLMQKEMYGALPGLACIGLQYGDGIVPPIIEALCTPESARMPTGIRQSLESSLGEAGRIVLEHILPQLTASSTSAQRIRDLAVLLPALNLRKHAGIIMRYHGQADVRERDILVARLSAIKDHSPGALCDLLAGTLTRLPPDLRLARDLQAKIGLRELEKIASRWAAGGHRGAQTVLERLRET